ncbi:hypothetical protein KKF91_13615 [Myxococcota bacterium]|nr:hypothetical protein [Myxococcota bacterium]
MRRTLPLTLLLLFIGCDDTAPGADPPVRDALPAPDARPEAGSRLDLGRLDAAVELDALEQDALEQDALEQDAAVERDAVARLDALEADAQPPQTGRVLLALGPDLPPGAREAIIRLVEAAARRPVEVHEAALGALRPGDLALILGAHPDAAALIPPEEVAALGPEGFILRAQGQRLAAVGNPLEEGAGVGNLGAGFAAFAALEALGFAFLHPLDPLIPEGLPAAPPALDISEAPRWRIRGMQLHTMHPIELCDLLNGWGPGGVEDAEGWAEMLPEWSRYLAWSLANRQNRVHWVLLHAEGYAAFADGPEHLARLGRLVDMAHDFGVLVGVDVPIALHQQHAWRLIREEGELEDELAQIRARVDHLMGAGFDYLATESGSSEFTSPDAARMLAWMDTLAAHLDEAHGKPAYIKIHASTGQAAEGFEDPETGAPLNFNFLPHYADPRLGVYPHTVQHYALDDPAPTYGNTDFSHLRRFLQLEAGARETVWHPETAYWVSFDIDVPLFLPVYARQRFHDLRLIAGDEAAGIMAPMDGQVIFSSGWTWGYWLNDVIAARAAWNPRLDVADERQAFQAMLLDALAAFGEARVPLASALDAAAEAQHRLLILGDYGEGPPEEIERRSGMAYMQGFDAWDDLASMAEGIPGVPHIAHQPDKLGLVDMRNPLHSPPNYTEEIKPLLEAMEVRFTGHAESLDRLIGRLSGPAEALLADLRDAAWMTALRARQIHGLYDYVDLQFSLDQAAREARLAEARGALDAAAEIVTAAEGRYRVPVERIAGWRANPTVYDFGYVWTVHSLYYWWRDEAKAVELPVSPCYLNIINGVQVGFGEGNWAHYAEVIRQITDDIWGISGLTQCLGAPQEAPVYPLDGWR